MVVQISISQLLMKLVFSATLEAFQYGFLLSAKMPPIKIQFILILPKLWSDLECITCTLLDLLSLSLLLIITR